MVSLGLNNSSPYRVRPFLSVVLDTIFFSRADSGFNIAVDDLWIEGHFLWFRERRFKGKTVHALRWRTRAFDFRGIPDLPRLVAHFCRLRKPFGRANRALPPECCIGCRRIAGILRRRMYGTGLALQGQTW